MSVSVFEHPMLSSLFGDPEVAEAFNGATRMSTLIAYEVALTRAVANAGLIPQDKADEIINACATFRPDADDLRESTIKDGLPVPGFVRQFKAYLGPDLAKYAHLGATSQDLSDTGVSLSTKRVNEVFAERLATILSLIDGLDERFGDNDLMGRTRMQAALRIKVGDRLASWRQGVKENLDDFPHVRQKVERLQTGGPVGNNHAFGDKAEQIIKEMAQELGLHAPKGSWHSDRTTRVRYSGWMATTSGFLGKIGQDAALMAQQGIDEIVLSGGGGSSAMAHKSNPISAEILVALARFNGVLSSGAQQSLIHEQERSGAAWALEWMIFPQMAAATGGALINTIRLLESVQSMGRNDY